MALGRLGVGSLSFSDLSVIVIFFVNGLQIRFTGARDRDLLRAIVIVLGLNLVVAPTLGGLAVRLLDLPLGLAVALALMASVPTTMSTAAVIAINVGGDRLWALALTITTVLLGSVTAPLAVSWILSAEVSISPWPILGQVMMIVMLPIAVGVLVRKTLLPKSPPWLTPIPSLAVLGVVWVTMSNNSEAAAQMSLALVAAMVVMAVVGHGFLLAAASVPAARMPTEQAMPVLFVASQKTLPLALTILVILQDSVPAIAAVAAVATVGCVVWHFLQVFADSLLSQRLAMRHAAKS